MKDIQKELISDLLRAGLGYGETGLRLFYKSYIDNSQIIIGNISIAIELLIKSYIAKLNLMLLFKDLPLELKCALCAPDELPSTFKTAPYKIELRSSNFKTIELDESITIFFTFFPDIKKQLGSHFRFLSKCRNLCVHSGLPDFRQYEVQRTIFLYLTLLNHLKEKDNKLFKYHYFEFGKNNKEFLTKFNGERLRRVHDAIEKAREKAKLIEKPAICSVDEWDLYNLECPICGSEGILTGDTQLEGEMDEDGNPSAGLTFIAFSFECEECGLMLEDYEELKMAGIEPVIDRTNEIDKWDYL